MRSLNGRLLLAASLVLAAFVSVTGFSLDRAFRESAETALRDRLQGHIYALLAASEVSPDGRFSMARPLADPRFSAPGSGLYAQVDQQDNPAAWQSSSLLGRELALANQLAPGEQRYRELTGKGDERLLALSFAISWEDEQKTLHQFTYHVAEHLVSLESQVGSFRRTLWGWLVALAILLLAAQGAVLRWGLRPLRRAANDVAAIEAGRQPLLEGEYPDELTPLTDNLNALLKFERAHLERYRNTLGDLAHSLKTPLAVLSGLSHTADDPARQSQTLEEQISRMREIVDYQLQKAAMSGRTSLSTPIAVPEVLGKIVATLKKVYAEKTIEFRQEVDGALLFRGEEGDLMELMGNLLDNACKWCRSTVSITARTVQHPVNERPTLQIRIEDDGPGIDPQRADEILQRGVRADTQIPGHGIGLAMVRDIVQVYGGNLSQQTSELGGACFIVELPT